jgi:hypothetical protein
VIDRRTFLAGLTVLAASRAAPAQPARKVYRIGILSLATTSDLVGPQPRSPSAGALLRGLRELGYIYGEHFVTELAGSRVSRSASLVWPSSWSASKWT